MRKSALVLNTLLIASLFLVISVKGVSAAPHLLLDPATKSVTNGASLNVTVKVDSGTETVGGVDGVGTYDSSLLDLVSVTKAPSMVFESNSSGGSCTIEEGQSGGVFSFSCYSNDSLSDKVSNGDLVILAFKAKSVGTAVVGFTCTNGSTSDSNIVKTATVSDVISCGENVSGSYTITAGSGAVEPTAVPTAATIVPTSIPTTAPTQLPQTGGVATTVGLVIFGAISFISALLLKFL